MSIEMSLPDGWIAKVSKTYQDRVFYYNFCTGVSTWKYPKFAEHYLDMDFNENYGSYKRYSDTIFMDKSAKQENYDEKLCRNFSTETIDTNQNEFNNATNNNKISFETPLQSKVPVAVVNPIIHRKKRQKKSSKNVSKALATNSPFLNENSNVNYSEAKSSNFHNHEEIKNKVISDRSQKELNQYQDIRTSRYDSYEIIEQRRISDVLNIDTIRNLSTDYYIVIDTNIFINEIDLIDKIKDNPIFNTGPPHIFIPWVVIQELDSIRKKNSATSNIFRLAQRGVRYINEMMKSKHPRFHGQSPKEVKDWAKAYSQNNDDRILECCLSLAEKLSPEKVILLTNDVNLINKALIAELNSYDIKSFQEIMINWTFDIKTENKQTKGSPNHNTFDRDQRIKELDKITLKVIQLLKVTLSSFFSFGMSNVYGPVLETFNLKLDVKGLLNIIVKYWKRVFSLHFSYKDKKNFEVLLNMVTQASISEKKECLAMLRTVEKIFNAIKVRWPFIETPIETIQKMQFEIQQIQDRKKNFKVEIIKNQPFENEAVLNVFEYDWIVMNNLSGMIMDFYHIPYSFPYDKPSVLPSEHNLQRLFCNFFPMVLMLKKYMYKIVEAIPKSSLPEIKVYKNLYLALKTFIPSLNIETQPPCTEFFNVNVLKNYCESPSNQEKLSIGYKQLDYIAAKLEETVTIMIAAKKARNSCKMECD